MKECKDYYYAVYFRGLSVLYLQSTLYKTENYVLQYTCENSKNKF